MLLTQQYYRNRAFGCSLSLVFMPHHASFFMVFARKFVIGCYSLNSGQREEPELVTAILIVVAFRGNVWYFQ